MLDLVCCYLHYCVIWDWVVVLLLVSCQCFQSSANWTWSFFYLWTCIEELMFLGFVEVAQVALSVVAPVCSVVWPVHRLNKDTENDSSTRAFEFLVQMSCNSQTPGFVQPSLCNDFCKKKKKMLPFNIKILSNLCLWGVNILISMSK